jgi:hypothetical protein
MHGFAAMGDTLASISVDNAVHGPGRQNRFGESVELKLREMLDRARKLLEDNRREVLAIAHALETHKTITGEDVEAIFKGTRGPTLDGAAYAGDGFLIEYEAYHLSALDAHRNQRKVSVALPAVSSPVPVGASTAPWAPPTVSGNGNGHGRSNGHGHESSAEPPGAGS